MTEKVLRVFRRVDIGGTDGLELAGSIRVLDDNGFRDDTLDDIEQAGTIETNGDQEIIASSVTELDVGDTLRARGVFRLTNTATGETYDVSEIFSQTAGNPVGQLFALTTPPPPWVFDNTNRTFQLFASDGTVPYASLLCFGAGTRIKKEDGTSIPVEAIRVGDRILTQNGSCQPVRWIGVRRVSTPDLASNPKLRPIRIKAGALGCDLPTADLIVSPQHRILVRSKIAVRIFDTDEVLIPAQKLLPLEGIEIAEDLESVDYYHLFFDRHEIIFSNGAETESLFAGPQALKTLPTASRAELAALFPELFTPDFAASPAKLTPAKGKHIRKLITRHQNNKKPLISLKP